MLKFQGWIYIPIYIERETAGEIDREREKEREREREKVNVYVHV